MTIIATCACGESFAAPPSLAGKKAKCPSCSQVIQIPSEAEQPRKAPAKAKSPVAPDQKTSGARPSATGPAARKQSQPTNRPASTPPRQTTSSAQKAAPSRSKSNPAVRRSAPIEAIPATADEGVVELQRPGSPANAGLDSNDVFGLGDLSSLESPQSDPLGVDPLAAAPASSGAPPQQAPGQPAAGTAAGWNTRQAAPKRGGNGMLIAVVVGVAAMLLVAVVGIVIAVLMMGDRSSEVAQNDETNAVDPNAGLANPVGAQSGNPSGSSTNSNGFGGSGANADFGGGRNQDSGFGQTNNSFGPGGGLGGGTGSGSSDSANSSNDNGFGTGESDGGGSGAFGQAVGTTSKSNSMAQAAVNWHSQKGRKLRGTIEVPDVDLVIYRYSWLCDLLPFMGYQSVYDQFNFEKRFIESTNITASETIIPQFLNPLDDRERCTDIRFPDFALTHFAGMSGVEDEPNDLAAEYPRSNLRAGIFGYDEIARDEDITDGLSDTIMIVGTGRIVQPWVAGGGATIRGARPPYFGKLNGLGSQGLPNPGVIVVMADGSIRHISADIDPRVFKALCTTHGAEEVDMNSSLIGKTQEDWFVQ